MKPFVFIAFGFGLKFISKQVELMGDGAPSMASGVSSARLGYHSLALVILLGAIGCFVAALVSIVGGRR
jgi:hypothetical protein